MNNARYPRWEGLYFAFFFFVIEPVRTFYRRSKYQRVSGFVHHPDCVYILEHSAVFLNGEVRLYEYTLVVSGKADAKIYM